MLKVGIHIHTNYVQKKTEGNYSPAELIDRAALLGFDALCITEHYIPCKDWPDYNKDPLASYNDFKGYASKKGILLIPGAEVYFDEGEVLVINYSGDFLKIKKITDLKKLPRNVLKIASHPFYGMASCLGNGIIRYRSLLDGWEYCHFYYGPFNPNKKATELAKQLDRVMIGTSDVHRLFQLNMTFTLVDSAKNPDAIVKAIRDGNSTIVTKQLPLHLFLITMFKVAAGTILIKGYYESRLFFKKLIS